MTTGRSDIKLYLDIVYRNRWWLVIPVILAAGAAVYTYKTLPRLYRASTTILVVSQRLPEAFVRTTVTAGIEERMASLRVQILSQSYLEQVVQEVGLVPEGVAQGEMEKACRKLRSQLELDYDRRRFSYFKIAAIDEDPERAARIADRLANLFIEQNTRFREEAASGTREFMERLVEDKKRELDAVESRRTEYRRRYVWELPEREQANLQLLSASQQRVATLSNEIQSREERLAYLRSQLRNLAAMGPDAGAAQELDPNLRRLAQMENELADLLTKYTEENPTVRRKRAEIEQFKARYADLLPTGSGDGSAAGTATFGPAEEIARIESQIESLEAERRAEQNKIAQISQRITNTPIREQELAALTRDYQALQSKYDELLKKKEQASEAEDLEASNQGEQFRVQDPARVPSAPYKPNAISVFAVCLAAGLGFGVAITAAREVLDNTVKTEQEFEKLFPEVPILAAIPRIEKNARNEKKTKKRKSKRKTAAMIAIVLLIMSLAVIGLAVRI
jgi:polysaccharide chain length determinant protein (PEP-CTERM system associated)